MRVLVRTVCRRDVCVRFIIIIIVIVIITYTSGAAVNVKWYIQIKRKLYTIKTYTYKNIKL